MTLLLLSAAAGLTPTLAAQAAGGTDSACTQASIQNDLTSGGDWTLDCAASSTTIPVTTTLSFDGGTAALRVASGKRVILDGQHSTGLLNTGAGTLSLDGLTFANGRAVAGAAIYAEFTTLSVADSTFIGNITFCLDCDGAALFNNGGAVTTITYSTFINNSASVEFASGTGSGGAIHNQGTLTVISSTFVGNTAGRRGGAIDAFGHMSIRNSIIANNTCAGVMTDAGHNLEWQNGGPLTCGFTNAALNNVNPMLGPLGDNGGSTQTLALGAGSPAIDAVPLVACVAADGAPLTTDQRGVPRPQGAACDVGAYEASASGPPPPPIVFSDDFESGNFAAWSTVQTGSGGAALVQQSRVMSGQFAARLSATTAPGSRAYARKTLAAPETSLRLSADVQVVGEGASGSTVPLFRLYDGSGNLLVSFYRLNHTNGQLWVQADGAYRRTTGALALGQWARVEVYVATQGAQHSTIEVRLNGGLIYANHGLSLGSAGVQTLQIGNDAHSQAFDIVVDNVLATP